MKLAIDLGNSNMKFAGEVDGQPVFKVVRSLVSKNSLDTNYVVSHAGKTLHFGVGDSLVEVDKTDRKYIKETILLGAYELYGSSEKVREIDLALGLPLDLYKSSKKEDFEDKVKNLTNVVLDGEVNSEPMLIKVKSIKICSEGYSAFINLLPAIDKNYSALIVDVGFGTTDAIGITYNKNLSKWQIDGYMTADKGLYNIYDAIKTEILDKEKTKSITDVSSIETIFLNNPIVLTEKGEFDINSYLYSATTVVDSLVTEINKKFTDMKSRKIYLVGGGADLMDKITGISLPHKQKVNQLTSLYANATGYLLQIK
jgi:hypothetical protein